MKQFVLGLTVDPGGSVLELNGKAVACVVPPPKTMNGGGEVDWTDAKNARRIDLIKKKYADGLAPAEHVELANLSGLADSRKPAKSTQFLRYTQGHLC